MNGGETMTDYKQQSRISKFLSYILRHHPEKIGLDLDENGWADVQELLERSSSSGMNLDLEVLESVVETNDKRRFSFNRDKSKIRANQGHSVSVELGYEPVIPPDILYHGTGKKNVESIFRTGIEKKGRHHVHLSQDIETAVSVGQRHGKAVVLEIQAGGMFRDGFTFYVSENGVWLTTEIPVKYLRKMDQ